MTDRPGSATDRSARGEPSAPLPDHPSAESTFREVNGVELHVVAAGDPDDPLVALLHGFPEFWYGWRPLVAPLAAAGYRVLVPDQRGYNRSGKPRGVGAYRRGTLAADVADLVASEGRGSAHVVGHDWGGGVAWDLALRHPGVVDRLGVVNAPHPAAYRAALTSNLAQFRKGWYWLFLQVPRIPEWALTRDDCRAMADSLRETARPGAFADADLERYRRAWTREGAITGMINWYRAAVRVPDDPPGERVDAPTLVVWGEDDPWLVPGLADRSLAHCEDGRVERFPDATHWVLHERPGAVSDLLVEFFDGND